jgi:acylphosphatase
MDERLHVFYSGRVQGVGFRFAAERAAYSLGIKGWARNLDDGRVEVVCEGSRSDLKEFMRKIDSAFSVYISGEKTEWADATGEFEGFDILL